MRELLDKANALCCEIKNCTIYRNYIERKAELLADEKSANIFRSYKALFNKYKSTPEYVFDQEKRLAGVYWELKMNTKAFAYFEAEKQLVELLKSIYSVIEQNFNYEELFDNNGKEENLS